jgi:hypothetical protein
MRPQTSRSVPIMSRQLGAGKTPDRSEKRRGGTLGVNRPFRLEEAALSKADPRASNLLLLTVRPVRAKGKTRGGNAAPQSPRKEKLRLS